MLVQIARIAGGVVVGALSGYGVYELYRQRPWSMDYQDQAGLISMLRNSAKRIKRLHTAGIKDGFTAENFIRMVSLQAELKAGVNSLYPALIENFGSDVEYLRERIRIIDEVISAAVPTAPAGVTDPIAHSLTVIPS